MAKAAEKAVLVKLTALLPRRPGRSRVAPSRLSTRVPKKAALSTVG